MFAVTISNGTEDLYIELFDTQRAAQQFASIEAYERKRSYTIVNCDSQDVVSQRTYDAQSLTF